ncbi:hypothetical protein [Streptomyces avermitilis]|uniref:hypothetical protein n=1 Tax=Streptomyces avermitilis TaxID=33903 RepID=UPI003828DA83
MIIPDVLDGDRVSIEGHDFELRGGHPDLVWRTEYLWQPEDRAVVGGVLLFAGLHAWIADTPTPRERAAWAETLAEMERLAPRFVMAGHRSAGSATDASVIACTRTYPAEFEEELTKSGNDSEALKAAILERHPDLGLLVALDLGTKVATGEMTWGCRCAPRPVCPPGGPRARRPAAAPMEPAPRGGPRPRAARPPGPRPPWSSPSRPACCSSWSASSAG